MNNNNYNINASLIPLQKYVYVNLLCKARHKGGILNRRNNSEIAETGFNNFQRLKFLETKVEHSIYSLSSLTV